jgi:hypothetical protein
MNKASFTYGFLLSTLMLFSTSAPGENTDVVNHFVTTS